jgi:hypothetical protein
VKVKLWTLFQSLWISNPPSWIIMLAELSESWKNWKKWLKN